MKQDTRQVTVVIPAFNAEKYIVECVTSAIKQEGVETRVILVDDASTDGTVDTLSNRFRFDERVFVLRQKVNGGVSLARNVGRRAISPGTNYLLFLDADDVLLPFALKEMADHLERNPHLGAVFGQAIAINERGETLNKRHRPNRRTYRNLRHRLKPNMGNITSLDLLDDNLVPTPGQVLIRVCDLLSNDDFDTALSGAADWDFWFRFSFGRQIFGLPTPVLRYRIHDQNMSRSRWWMRLQGLRMRVKWLTISDWNIRASIVRSYVFRVCDRSRLARYLLPNYHNG